MRGSLAGLIRAPFRQTGEGRIDDPRFSPPAERAPGQVRAPGSGRHDLLRVHHHRWRDLGKGGPDDLGRTANPELGGARVSIYELGLGLPTAA
jgi:hypothetical protein